MTFLEFASAHGLVIDRLVQGRWARVKTVDHPKKRNGAYRYLGDVGFIQNWAEMDGVAIWRSDGRNEQIDRKEWARRRAQEQKDEARRQARARDEAARIIRGCERSKHVYLASKGFPEAQGLVFPETNELIIPMRDFRDYGTVNGVQRIAPDGSKLFLSGSKAKGSVFVIAKGAWRERWLCEGFATGLSLQAALMDLRRSAEIIVCFSAGNLQHVAPMVKRPAFVMADHDASKAGEKAAEATGLPWVMPPVEGMDANDQHKKYGLRSLVDLIRELSSATWPTLRAG